VISRPAEHIKPCLKKKKNMTGCIGTHPKPSSFFFFFKAQRAKCPMAILLYNYYSWGCIVLLGVGQTVPWNTMEKRPTQIFPTQNVSVAILIIFKYTIFKYTFFFFGFFQDRISLYSSGCPGTHSLDQTGLELRNPPASASRVLGLKACATTPCHYAILEYQLHSWWRALTKA
jgi:hypothetical protein